MATNDVVLDSLTEFNDYIEINYADYNDENAINNDSDNLSQFYSILPQFYTAYFNLPSTYAEAQYLALRGKTHPSLQMSANSLIARRSANRAIIFLYGISGSGKSSTINHLFGKKLLNVNDDESCTTDVSEYVAKLRSDVWKADNLEISFIDLPGYGDTRHEFQDAVNLAGIESFINKHGKLGDQNENYFYPNIVLFIVSAADRRMMGDNADTARMLKAASKLKVIDSKRENVVFVVTSVHSIKSKLRGEKCKKISENLAKLSKTYLSFSAPVVFIENDIEELKSDSDWTILFNGERQPLNLFNVIIKVMKRWRDDVGIEASRIFFCDKLITPKCENTFKIKDLKKIHNETFKEITIKDLDAREIMWLERLRKPLTDYIELPVSKKLLEYAKHHSDREMKNNIEPLLYCLQENNLTQIKDIESKQLIEIEDKLSPYKLDLREKQILTELFKLKQMQPHTLNPVIGYGYDILTNSVLQTSIVDEANDAGRLSHGFTITHQMEELEEVYHFEVGCYSMESEKECIDHFLDVIGLRNLAANVTEFPSVGYNIVPNIEAMTKNREITFYIERSLYRIKLRNDYVLSSSFHQDVFNLPDAFDSKDKDSSSAYQAFLNKYGFFVVFSSYIAGRIEGIISIPNSITKISHCIAHVKSAIIRHICDLECENHNKFSKLGDKCGTMDSDMLDCAYYHSILMKAKLSWYGGDNKYYINTMGDVTHKLWKNWTNSLRHNAIISRSKIHLLQITTCISYVAGSEDKIESVRKAIDYITSGKLVSFDKLVRGNSQKKSTNYNSPRPNTRAIASFLSINIPKNLCKLV